MTDAPNQFQFPASIRAHEGGKLSSRQARLLEKKIEQDPSDINSRISLLGYYHRTQFLTISGFVSNAFFHKMLNQEKYLNLVRWIIRNHAGSEIASLPEIRPPCRLNYETEKELNYLWKEQVDTAPDNVEILANAAAFLTLTTPEMSEHLLRRAKELQPENAELSYSLSSILQRDLYRNPETLLSVIEEKSAEIEKSTRINPYSLGDLAKLSFAAKDYDKARSAAEQLLKIAQEDPMRDSSDCGNGIHDGNCILGRLALVEGKIAEAKSFLIAASSSPGAPSLNSFGPEMDLAQDLLERGERRAVIKYLLSCHRFWNGIVATPFIVFWIVSIMLGFSPELNSVRRLSRQSPKIED